LAGLAVASLLGGCEDDDFNDCRGIDTASSALFGGRSDFRGERDLAVVALLSATDQAQEKLCSGVLISPGLVLTAKHCALQNERINVLFGRSLERSIAEVRIDRFIRDPDRDLAIGVLDPSGLPSITPIAPLLSAVPAVGDEVTLAGFGLTEDDVIGQLRFAQEQVSAVDDETITVDGMGESGACIGDSGGPLIVDDPDSNKLRVVGILTVGSPSCSDLDLYQRLGPVSDLIQDAIDADDARPAVHQDPPDAGFVDGC
jgi:hypothetical protein